MIFQAGLSQQIEGCIVRQIQLAETNCDSKKTILRHSLPKIQYGDHKLCSAVPCEIEMPKVPDIELL